MVLTYDSIVDNFHRLTGSEMDFLFYTAQFQDGQPIAGGFDWRTVSGALGISKATFFHTIKSLKNKGFIFSYAHYDNWQFQFIGNEKVFEEREPGEKGASYLDLHYEMLHNEEFIKLKKNEKLLCLKCLRLSGFGQKKIRLSNEKLCETTGATMQSVKKYVKTLKEKIFGDLMDIDLLGISVANESGEGNPFNKRNTNRVKLVKEQKLKFHFKKNKMPCDDQTIKDLAHLYVQYRKLFPKDANQDAIMLNQIFECFAQKGKVAASYVHTSIRRVLQKMQSSEQTEEIYVPRTYENYFLPYEHCFDPDRMREAVGEMIDDVRLNYIENKKAKEILDATENNIVTMLTGVKKHFKVKGAVLTYRQCYSKLMEASKTDAGPPSAEGFKSFVKRFVDVVIQDLSQNKRKIKSMNAYLRSWLYDHMEKMTTHLV